MSDAKTNGLLAGRRAVVTGSSQGMGFEIAKLLVEEGVNVVLNARGSAGAAEVETGASSLNAVGPGRAIARRGPVNDIGFAEELIAACVETFGGIDILVNNAGITGGAKGSAVDRVPIERWRDVLDVNLNGSFYTARFAIPHMKQQRWGRVVHCTSGAAFGSIGGSCYAASKGALVSLTYAMAADFGMFGVTTNAYNPQARSRLSDSAPGGFEKMLGARLHGGYCDEAEYEYCLGFQGPEAIAPWIAYLCLDEASYLNGRVFGVEGRRVGLHAAPVEERIIWRDQDRDAPWSLGDLRRIAPKAFPVKNRWPQRSEADITVARAETEAVFG